MNALLIDIGNTRIKWRVIDTRGSDSDESLDQAWRGTGGALALIEIDQLAKHWQASPVVDVEAALLSNVASPGAEAIVRRALVGTWPAIRIETVHASSARCGVVNGYANPVQLGSDRWLAMIGGHHLLPDRSLLICSFGTATTIDLIVVDEGAPAGQARFVGGQILPGVDAMRRVLAEGTARLPDDGRGKLLDFADNTADAIASGIIGAQVGAVERAWRNAQDRSVGDALTCAVAGGAASMVTPLLVAAGLRHRAVPDLVLRGLAVVARGWVD